MTKNMHNPTRRRLVAGAALALGIGLCPAVVMAGVFIPQDVRISGKHWVSYSTQSYGRGLGVAYTKSINDSFFIDFKYGHCKQPDLVFTRIGESVTNKRIEKKVAFRARVDRDHIYSGRAMMYERAGDDLESFYLNFKHHADSHRLLGNIDTGADLRIQLTMPGKSPIYDTYALRGAKTSIQRAHFLCVIGTNENRQYFPPDGND